MLWDMTWALVKEEGASQDLLGGDGGNVIALKLVLEALKLQPCYPGFVDARDAILLADSLLYDGRHLFPIWKAFARRGLGYGAEQGSSFNSFDGRRSTLLPPAFLTEVESFEALDVRSDIEVSFKSRQEYDNRHFILERSIDMINYIPLSQFVGELFSPRGREYRFTDQDVLLNQIYYYRLSNIDIAGNLRILAIDSAIIVPFEDVLVFPNPSPGLLQLRLDRSWTGTLEVNLYHLNGLLIRHWTFEARDAYKWYRLESGDLPDGLYILEMMQGDLRVRRKWVKTRQFK